VVPPSIVYPRRNTPERTNVSAAKRRVIEMEWDELGIIGIGSPEESCVIAV
jgi:hypothetical protein